MNAPDRTRLLRVLSAHVGRVAADLRAQMLVDGPVQERARRVYADEKVGDDYAVWTDLLSRRAAVMWVLKSVYARVLEDRGLLSPGRLLDPEAQQLFEKLAPNLGETAFLRWVWRDLATSPGGLPELFAPQPAEVATPSDALSRELIEIWRKVDPDTGARWSFANEKFDGELMGDLYQELDPVVKDRFALCQTPDFVRAFILDRTLTPAIEEYGADVVRLIDPACGSGHFLIDGLRRLVVATGEQHPDWDRRKLVEHALRRVVGTDLNDYACALARARLIMTAADLAGVDSLREASAFHPHVYWADGLEQVEKDEAPKPQQTGLFTQGEEPPPRATLTRPEVREALREVLKGGFHAVVANPPYIVESDENRKAYHREKVGRKQRYVSAYRQYSLGSPFTERCFQLAVREGYVGIIKGNGFMKKEFGKPLIEDVLPRLDLTLVVDTSNAGVQQQDATTVMVFGRNRQPVGDNVRAVMGRRGETRKAGAVVGGRVWASIKEGWSVVGWENEFISVADLSRDMLGKHPWSLAGGGAQGLMAALLRGANQRLGDLSPDIGRTMHTGLDEPFLVENEGPAVLLPHSLALVRGEDVRDWAVSSTVRVLFPYDDQFRTLAEAALPAEVHRWLWRAKTALAARVDFKKTLRERGLSWYEWSMFFRSRLAEARGIAFPVVATHNHFVFVRSQMVFNSKAPAIKLPRSASDDDYYAVLGLLNSSVTAFWMRQVFSPRGGESTGTKIQSEPFARRLELDGTKMEDAPLTDNLRGRVVALATRLSELSQELAAHRPAAVLAVDWRPAGLRDALQAGALQLAATRNLMVTYQEELDWTAYVAYGLLPLAELRDLRDLRDLAVEPLASSHRPFAIRLARAAERGEATSYWFEAMGVSPCTEIPNQYSPETVAVLGRRLSLIEASPQLAMLEAPENKRKWEPLAFDEDLLVACRAWLADRVEAAAKTQSRPVTEDHLVAALLGDARVQAVAEVYTGRADSDLATLVREVLTNDSVPNHPYHIYTEVGLTKRQAWEDVWALQRREDAGENVGTIAVPPEYSQGSRGKSTDFLRNEYWKLRGSLDVPKERFIAFTEVPGGGPTLYGWAGWTPLQRLKALLALDEKLEDAGHSIGDRIGVLDSAWRLLPDVAREDAPAAARLKAELSSLVGKDGPSPEMLAAWKAKFPPPGTGRGRKKAT